MARTKCSSLTHKKMMCGRNALNGTSLLTGFKYSVSILNTILDKMNGLRVYLPLCSRCGCGCGHGSAVSTTTGQNWSNASGHLLEVDVSVLLGFIL